MIAAPIRPAESWMNSPRAIRSCACNHIQEGTLPLGWTGKCNALHTTVNQASGSWLLFVDSDVVLEPDVLRGRSQRRSSGASIWSSLLPALEGHTFWENLVVPLAGCAVSTMYLVAFTNSPEMPNTAFANGQYLCIRRDVYDAIGGHEIVRDRFCEDVEMGGFSKRGGFRPRISWAADFAAVRMYSSLGSIFRGWGRNFFAGSLGPAVANPRRHRVCDLLFVLRLRGVCVGDLPQRSSGQFCQRMAVALDIGGTPIDHDCGFGDYIFVDEESSGIRVALSARRRDAAGDFLPVALDVHDGPRRMARHARYTHRMDPMLAHATTTARET